MEDFGGSTVPTSMDSQQKATDGLRASGCVGVEFTEKCTEQKHIFGDFVLSPIRNMRGRLRIVF